jgi:hypothetical protein
MESGPSTRHHVCTCCDAFSRIGKSLRARLPGFVEGKILQLSGDIAVKSFLVIIGCCLLSGFALPGQEQRGATPTTRGGTRDRAENNRPAPPAGTDTERTDRLASPGHSKPSPPATAATSGRKSKKHAARRKRSAPAESDATQRSVKASRKP